MCPPASAPAHTIATTIHARAGTSPVVQRILAVLARRGYEIGRLEVLPHADPGLARVVLVCTGEAAGLEQAVKQLGKLVEVTEVRAVEVLDRAGGAGVEEDDGETDAFRGSRAALAPAGEAAALRALG